jgi:hypothetical protein
MTLGADGKLYLTAVSGMDIFNPATGTIASQAARAPMTWPVIGAAKPLGPVSHGPDGTVTSLATKSTTGIKTGIASLAPPSTPALVTYTIATQSFDVTYGPAGDVYEDVTQSADGALWVSANTPGTKGLTGYVFSSNAACSVATIPAAVGSIADAGNFIWVATDPQLNPATLSQIVQIDPATGRIVTTYSLPSSSTVTNMTAGPDGALWFTDKGLNEIGRLASGSVTYYPVLSANAGLRAIGVGCDGALWFTEAQANRVGRITTSGYVSEYAVPTANAGLGEILGCVQKAVYFVESHAVGKIVLH